MLKTVDHVITGVGTLAIGIVIYWIQSNWLVPNDVSSRKKRCGNSADDDEFEDVFFKVRYGIKDSRIEHAGSCHCESVRFSLWAPRNIQAVDSNDMLNSKKGRFAHVVHTDLGTLGYYMPKNTSSKHFFCKVCAVHIFHMNPNYPKVLDVNVHCLDVDRIDTIAVAFIPDGSQPVAPSSSDKYHLSGERHGVEATLKITERVESQPSSSSSYPSSSKDQLFNRPSFNRSSTFEDTLLAWSKLDQHSNSGDSVPSHSSVRSESFSAHSAPHSRSSSMTGDQTPLYSRTETADVHAMKTQLEKYLKHHVEDTSESSSVTSSQPEEEYGECRQSGYTI